MPRTLSPTRLAIRTYPLVDDLLWKLVFKFVRKHGGDRDEVRQNAEYQFVQAIHKYEPRRGPIENWIKFFVYRELQSDDRTERRRAHLLPRSKDVVLEDLPGDELSLSPLEDLLCRLGEDAATIVRLVFETPKQVEEDIKRRDETKGVSPTNIRTALRSYLRGVGWAASRISESFGEIRAALG